MKFKYNVKEKIYICSSDTDEFVIYRRKDISEFKWKLDWGRWDLRFNVDSFKNAKALAKMLNDHVEKL